MDITFLFEQCVNSNILNDSLSKHYCLKKYLKLDKQQCHLHTNIKIFIDQARKLNNFLLVYRKMSYQRSQHLKEKSKETNNTQSEISLRMEYFLKSCFQVIDELKVEVLHLGNKISGQNQEYYYNVLLTMEQFAKDTKKQYILIQSFQSNKKLKIFDMTKITPALLISKINYKWSNPDMGNNNARPDCDLLIKTCPYNLHQSNDEVSKALRTEYSLKFSEDRQIFNTENIILFNELNYLTEDIQEIHKKVLQISELQSVFSDKVLDQDKNLEHILSTVIGSTENVIEANEFIRKAIQRNAGLRVWILFFLLVMSFTLMFLDWYNI